MKLSFAITVCNEIEYISSLLTSLIEYVLSVDSEHSYEIVILDDFSTDIRIKNLYDKAEIHPFFFIHHHALNGDFAAHKNVLSSKCTGNFILQLDADELITWDVLNWIPALIGENPDVDAYWIPRVNTVDGLTLDYARKWGWSVMGANEFTKTRNVTGSEYDLLKHYDLIIKDFPSPMRYRLPIVCWPDNQMRLYRNHPDIKWKNKVHEQLTGFKQYSNFPQEFDYAIIHQKTLERQIGQNNFYDSLQR